GIEPTPYGHALTKRGAAVFDELRLGVKDLEFLADPTAGEARIGAPIAFSGFVAAAIDKLARRYPRVVCHLLVGGTPMTYRAVEERELDAVITRIVPPIAEGHIKAEVLYEDTLVVAAASESPWSQRRRVTLNDLVNEPWTLAPPDSLPGSWAAD